MIYPFVGLPGNEPLGTLSETYWRHSTNGPAQNTILEIVDDVTAGSGKALLAKVVSDGTENTYRAEIAGSNSYQAPPKQIGKFIDGDEVWIGFSLMLKKGSQSPLDFNSVNFQIIQTSGSWCPSGFAGPTIHLTQRNGRFFVEQSWDSNLNSTNEEVRFHIALVDVGEVVLEKWTRFIVHIIFQSTQPGVTEFWRDNKLVYRNTTNPNNYNQSNPTTAGMKFGSYIPSWKSPAGFPQAGVYVAWAFDNIIIGDSNSSLSEMMSPASNPTPKPLPGYTL